MNQPATPQVIPIDDDGVTTEPAETALSSEEFYSEPEAELADIQEKAARNAAAAKVIANTSQNEQIRDNAQKTLAVMNNFIDVAGQLSDAAAVAGDGVRRGVI